MTKLHLADLQCYFPDGVVPRGLDSLVQFQWVTNYHPLEFPHNFRITSDISFDRSYPNQESFARFASDMSGGLYAVWSGSDKPLAAPAINDSPVMFIDSETRSTVVASSFEEFLGLLMLGVYHLGIVAAEGEAFYVCREHRCQELRDWISREASVVIPDSPHMIVNIAKRKFWKPFCGWYRDWTGCAPSAQPPTDDS